MKLGAVENKARLAMTLFVIALLLIIILTLVLYSQAGGQASSPVVLYLFSYQVVALIFGLGLIFLLVRWLLRPYRRMVEAARGSPVRASRAESESEFVVETFQALIEQLQEKERELADLHALERKRAERSERLSERLIANIPSGLVTIDSRGVVMLANSHALRIFESGEPAHQIEARKIDTGLLSLSTDYRTFFHLSPRISFMVQECLDKATSYRREEVELTLPDGRVRNIGLSVSPISDSSQNVEGALCLLTDITEVLELRERMKLQENLANLGEMAAGLAHEFKNSLATIHGYVQLIEAQHCEDKNSARRKTAIVSTLNEVSHLARLVTDFLNFARPQQLSLSPVDLDQVIEQSVTEIKQSLASADIELKVHGEFATVSGDESLLRRVFVNLVRNAAEAIDPHSDYKRIEVVGSVDTGHRKSYAHVKVIDTGAGIAAEDVPRVFIPFFTTKTRGYGIGLAIVKKILIAHGGDVTVERSSPAGTVFHCRLPLTNPPNV
ncbi:MAG TPA: ATP-binding protein [Blastocatellia bacterium]|jgi:PAS domain S-box-containing protein